jgi:hypothetical protein
MVGMPIPALDILRLANSPAKQERKTWYIGNDASPNKKQPSMIKGKLAESSNNQKN